MDSDSILQVKTDAIMPSGYINLLRDIKEDVRRTRIKTAIAVNTDLTRLYWSIGKRLLEEHKKAEWGDKILEALSNDLRSAFPDTRGFSRSNLKYMRQFAAAYSDISRLAVSQIPWGHNILLISRLNDNQERLWYAQQTIENAWSRNTLAKWIDSRLYYRHGKAITNFSTTLPENQANMAQKMLKDPYCLDFLDLRDNYVERELENALMDSIQQFLLELGTGFAFVGKQYPVTVDGEDFFIDLLFYHIKLRSYYIVELKTGEFRPEHAGKMGFYLAAVDNILCEPDDNPSIGIILCRSKKPTVTKWALKYIKKPIGIAGYDVKPAEELPQDLKEVLPSPEEFVTRLCIAEDDLKLQKSDKRTL